MKWRKVSGMLGAMVAAFVFAGACLPAGAAEVLRPSLACTGIYGVPGHGETTLREFTTAVQERSGGNIVIDAITPGLAGSEREIFEQTVIGAVDMCFMSDMTADGFMNTLGFAWLPFMITTYEDADKYYNSGWIHDEIVKRYEAAGVIKIANIETGVKALGNIVRPINSFSDFKGLKIRVSEIPDLQRFMSLLGCLPVAMSNSETPTAIQQGTIDGVDTTLYNLKAQGVLDMMKYVTLTGHQYSGGSVLCNKAFWDKLTDEQKKILTECAQAAGNNNMKNKRAEEAELRRQLEAEGRIQVAELSAETKAEMLKAGQVVWEEYAHAYGEDIYKKIMETFGTK